MKDQVVTRETAELAKTKGFNENTHSNYYLKACDKNEPDKAFLCNDGSELERKIQIDEETYHNVYHVLRVPTQSLLQKWLREIHHLEVGAYKKWRNGLNARDNTTTYQTIVRDFTTLRLEYDSTKFMSLNGYETYEAALEEGLFEALKLIEL